MLPGTIPNDVYYPDTGYVAAAKQPKHFHTMFCEVITVQSLRFRVEFIGKRIHYSVNSGVIEAIFYTYINPGNSCK